MSPELRALAQQGLVFNTPLSEEHAASLVLRLARPEGHVLDLGCGWAELLLRVVASSQATRGTGVDLDRAALQRGRLAARQRGLAGRIELQEGDITSRAGRAD